jgi:hypothetical protein
MKYKKILSNIYKSLILIGSFQGIIGLAHAEPHNDYSSEDDVEYDEPLDTPLCELITVAMQTLAASPLEQADNAYDDALDAMEHFQQQYGEDAFATAINTPIRNQHNSYRPINIVLGAWVANPEGFPNIVDAIILLNTCGVELTPETRSLLYIATASGDANLSATADSITQILDATDD